MNRKELVKKIEKYATELLTTRAVCKLYYHNIDHTKRVVKNVEIIGKYEGITEDELFILKTIAWFHDLGYVSSYDGHEEKGKVICRRFLEKEELDNQFIELVLNGIEATRVPQNPKNKLEKIIADADLFDIGTEDYFELSEKLFKEWTECGSPGEKTRMWEISLEFLKGHNYFTSYALKHLNPKKLENIKTLERRLQ